MSEYNRFLNHFNKNKNTAGDDNLSEREDTIPVTGAIKKQTEEPSFGSDTEICSTQETAPEKEPVEINLPDKNAKDENQDEIVIKNQTSDKRERFIKTNDAQFIAVNSKNRQDVPTEATKYTDRLLPKIPEKKAFQGTSNPNSYDGMHAPLSEEKMFRPINNDEKTKQILNEQVPQTPEKSAREQTKIIPSVIEEKNDSESSDTKEVIVEKIPDDKTKEIAAKGSLLRKIAKTSELSGQEEVEGQLSFEGFSENEEAGEAPDETQMLEELSKVRADRIKNFRFWTKSEEKTGESEDKSFSPQKEELQLPAFLMSVRSRFSHLNTDFVPMGEEEYQDPSRRKEIFSSLMSLKKTTLMKALFISVIGIILLVINIVTSISAAMNNGFFSVFGGSPIIYSIINLVILLLCGAVMADDLKKGLFSLLKVRPRTDTALLIMYLGALAQTVASFFSTLKPESEYHLLSGAAVLLCAPMLLAKSLYYDSARHCFKAAGTTSDKYYLRKVSDKETISELLKDSKPTETNVVYTGKTRFISGFLKRSANAAFSGQISSRFILIAALGALISGVIGLIASRSPVYALGCFSVTAALSFPVGCLVLTGYMISMENSMLSVKSSFINGYGDAFSFSLIDDIILDGDEIFSAEIVSSAAASNVSQKQAEFCAAVLTSKADGILKNAFSVFSQGLQDRYPEVEGFVFEDKLGFSAWISDCRILLGTKQLLINHNVELPEANTVPFIMDETTKPLFLAIEGHFAAVFSVKYSCDKTTAKSLGSLAANGANILLNLKEPNLSEDFAESLLQLPSHSLRITASSNSSRFDSQKKTITDMEDTGIVFSESFDSFSLTLAGAIKLERIRKTAKLLYEAATAAGILLGILFCITNALTFINGWPAVVLQLCWMLLSFALIPSLSAASLKKKINISQLPAINKTLYDDGENDLPDFDDDDIFGNNKSTSEESSTAQENTDDTCIDIDDETKTDETKISGLKKKFRAVFSEKSEKLNTGADNTFTETEGEQLILEGAPYTKPPTVVDPDKLLKEKELEENAKENNTAQESSAASPITDDILDSFAQPTVKTARAPKKSNGKKSFFGRLSADDASYAYEDSTEEENRPAKKKSVFSILDEKLPSPPRFDLGKKDSKTEDAENDPLNAKFVPPDTSAYQTYYKDDFFSSFDTEEDDKAFADIRKKREERESTADEFDFWTKK